MLEKVLFSAYVEVHQREGGVPWDAFPQEVLG